METEQKKSRSSQQGKMEGEPRKSGENPARTSQGKIEGEPRKSGENPRTSQGNIGTEQRKSMENTRTSQGKIEGEARKSGENPRTSQGNIGTEQRKSTENPRTSQGNLDGEPRKSGENPRTSQGNIDTQPRKSMENARTSLQGSEGEQRKSTENPRTSQQRSEGEQRGSLKSRTSQQGMESEERKSLESQRTSLKGKMENEQRKSGNLPTALQGKMETEPRRSLKNFGTSPRKMENGTGDELPPPLTDQKADQGEYYGEGIQETADADTGPLDSFCQDHIRIPPQLPNILKQFTKAAIKTQPRDLDRWSAAYFRAMAEGQVPPVKETLEYPAVESKDGLTVGLLRVLDRQLKDSMVSVDKVRLKWIALCLDERAFNEIIEIGRFDDGELIDWKKILAILCTSLGTNLTDTMRVICQVLTEQKEGGDPVIPYVVWWELYLFLARLDGTIPAKQLQEVNDFLVRRAHAKFCLIGPSDFLHVDCPPLY